MDSVIFLFVIALISAGAGVAIGVLISSLRTDKTANSSGQKSQSNLAETARIMQDGKTGNLFLEINGVAVRNPADFNPSQREQMIAQLQSLLAWLKPSPQELPVPPVSPQARVDAPAMLPVTPPPTIKTGPLDLLARSISPDAKLVPRGPQSIAAQIDEILQEKLAGSSMAGRGIRLMELPTKGLVVMVGLQQYEDVDAVPDLEIRALIRQSVAEWESLHTQG